MDRDKLQAFSTEVKEELGIDQFVLTLRNEDTIELNSLIVNRESRKQGRGSAAMERLIAFADHHGCRLFLTPGMPNKFHGTTSRKRLVDFYKRFGFYENRGRQKDFRFTGGMLRDPKPAPKKQMSESEIKDINPALRPTIF